MKIQARMVSSFFLPKTAARTAESIYTSRAKLAQEYNMSWFRELEYYLNKIN